MDRVTSTSLSVPPAGAANAGADDLNYLNDMLVELASIARRRRLDMLVYLIDMAHCEAADQIRRGVGGGKGHKGPHRRPAQPFADGGAQIRKHSC